MSRILAILLGDRDRETHDLGRQSTWEIEDQDCLGAERCRDICWRKISIAKKKDIGPEIVQRRKAGGLRSWLLKMIKGDRAQTPSPSLG